MIEHPMDVRYCCRSFEKENYSAVYGILWDNSLLRFVALVLFLLGSALFVLQDSVPMLEPFGALVLMLSSCRGMVALVPAVWLWIGKRNEQDRPTLKCSGSVAEA